MEKCPKCGAEGLRGLTFPCGSRPRRSRPGVTESVGCLRRQLAASQQRVAKLEAALCCDTPYRDQASELAKLRAQMEELRQAWPHVKSIMDSANWYAPAIGAANTINRILGGGK